MLYRSYSIALRNIVFILHRIIRNSIEYGFIKELVYKHVHYVWTMLYRNYSSVLCTIFFTLQCIITNDIEYDFIKALTTFNGIQTHRLSSKCSTLNADAYIQNVTIEINNVLPN